MVIVIAAVEAAIEVAVRKDAVRAPHATPWFTVPATAVVVLPLLGRRRHPFAAPVLVWLLAAGFSFADGRLIEFTAGIGLAGMVASFLLGNLADAARARIGLLVVVAGAAIISANDPNHAAGDVLFLPGFYAIPWLAGYTVRERVAEAAAAEERARLAEREREAAARIAVAEERARIARELHDVVAHSMSVMVLQVGAIRHNLPDGQESDRDALAGVERTGRTALAEMRHLLGALRSEDDGPGLAPQPGLDGLDPLLDGFRRAGLPVDLHVDGDPVALPATLDLSAYRIVQEGLTNALKHAHAGHADVRLRYDPGELRIDVRDDGFGSAPTDGLGHGLAGIRERVKIYGGEMTAGAVEGGGFQLSTRLPLDREAR
jgi:signal transduction histidine kinase